MTPNGYQKLALRTEKTPLFVNDSDGKPSLKLSRLMHAAMGIQTEGGELTDMLKKHLMYGKPLDEVNVVEEAIDAMWYAAIALDAVGVTLEDGMERNIAKLTKRFPDRFTEDAALNRNLDAERATLEKSANIYPSHEEIAALVSRFNSLMQSPEPGLLTWIEARNECATELRDNLNLVLGR